MLLRPPGMSSRLRWYRANRIYEITTRTFQERLLLRPGTECRALVLGVIARAMALFPAVSVYAFTFLSNHYHMLASASDGGSLSRFLNHVNSNVARELGRLHRWGGRFWHRRASVIEVVDDDAVLARLRYIISQGLKEGLVARASEWSGASAIPALVGDGPLTGVWIDRDLETRAARRGATPPARSRITLPIPLTPIPQWAHLPPEALAARHRALVADVEAEAACQRSGPPLGIRAVEARDPHARPACSESTPAPLCHASSAESRSAYRAAYRAFVDAFRRAAAVMRAAGREVFSSFPGGSCPRPGAYVAEEAERGPRQLSDRASVPAHWLEALPAALGASADMLRIQAT